jgi:predicted ATP-dependent protease
MADIRLGMSMLLTVGQSAEQHQRATINKEDVQWALENAKMVKNLTELNKLSKRIKKKYGKTIDF